MKEIKLTQNQVTIVDDWRFNELNQYKWYANISKHSGTFYAQRNIIDEEGKRTVIQMQKVIMNTPKGMYTDHINFNTLDNREENLRICTNSQNLMNRPKQKNNTSGYKGVYKNNDRWQTRVKLNGKIICLGTYDTTKEAAQVYNNAAIKYFGEFAKLNEIVF